MHYLNAAIIKFRYSILYITNFIIFTYLFLNLANKLIFIKAIFYINP